MVKSILLRPWDLLCVLWFVAHIPMTVLLDAQSSEPQQLPGCGHGQRRRTPQQLLTTTTHCWLAAAARVAVLPPEVLAVWPQQLKDLLAWHIKTNDDHLVRRARLAVSSSSAAANHSDCRCSSCCRNRLLGTILGTAAAAAVPAQLSVLLCSRPCPPMPRAALPPAV